MKKVNYWTIPCNVEFYDIIRAFHNLTKIEWRQTLSEVKENDIVYIYVGRPYSQMLYKCRINKVNLSKPTIDDRRYWADPSEYGKYKKYMELELIKEFPKSKLLSNTSLKKYGLGNIYSQAGASTELVEYLEDIDDIQMEEDNINYINKKRVANKKDWLKVLDSEKQEDNKALDILLYLYDCKNYTSNGKNIAKYFDIDVAAVNSYIRSFGKRVVELLNLEEQIYDEKSTRRWNIPFETIPELNKRNNVFTWKLRKELVEALMEKYDLSPKNNTIEERIKRFVEEYPYEDFCEKIKKDLEAREYFVNKFTLTNIINMTLDEFVIGKAEIDDKGRETFCYLLERSMQNLGQMLGAFVSKFGVWYAKEEGMYKYTQKYGSNLEEAFEKLKQEISFLLVNAYNNNYEEINKCEIANIFKGKILSTYFPEKYLCIFDEEDVDKFLNLLGIQYDMYIVDSIEKKKLLLQAYKENNELLKEYSDYYFLRFLYKTFKGDLEEKHTVSGEIDYNIEFVDFEYVKKHETAKRNNYRSRETDYEKINRNKKDVGNRGENAILRYEINKLKRIGLNDLAEQVDLCENDAVGYDIVSFDEHGNEIHIEVKTNSTSKNCLDFYLTSNELEKLMEDEKYYIYYLYNIKNKPKCHIINKDKILSRKDEFFEPVIYKINIDLSEKGNHKGGNQ